MKVTPTELPEVMLLEPKVFGDDRGYFVETWNERRFAELGLEWRFVQENESRSGAGVLRGLHYQVKQPQGKLVRVVSGEIYDVAVDLRRSSPRFGKWTAARLSGDNHHALWVPPGFAHGFYVPRGFATVVYLCTDFYAPEHERTLLWSDPAIGVEWPLDAAQSPTVSAKDQVGKRLADAEVFP